MTDIATYRLYLSRDRNSENMLATGNLIKSFYKHLVCLVLLKAISNYIVVQKEVSPLSQNCCGQLGELLKSL